MNNQPQAKQVRYNVASRSDGKFNLWRSFYDPITREDINTGWEVIQVFSSREEASKARDLLYATGGNA